MKTLKFLILIIFTPIIISAQTFFISGKIQDSQSEESLSFANIRVMNTAKGTSANMEGEFELKLTEGKYRLIASFIGYISDTIEVYLNKNISGLIVELNETSIDLPEVVVTPGENPALQIIEKAIDRKEERNNLIKSYTLEAYSKLYIKTENEIGAGSRSISIGIGNEDTSKGLKITGIIENKSNVFFEKPDNYKEIIVARKQTANFPPSINVLTGSRFIQNLYEENVNFLGQNIPGPLSDDALDYYYFYIEDQVAIDNTPVYKIYMAPDDESDPGLAGNIFIKDSTFDLIKVDLQLNDPAKVGGLFKTVKIFQQFYPYGKENIFMPVDYRLYATANYLGLAEFAFGMNTILYDYTLNEDIPEDIFNKAVITVLPEADEKDSSYWQTTQTIPTTKEEKRAYERIDSLKNISTTFWEDYSILAPSVSITDQFAVSNLLSLYHFNRVEGNAFDFGLYLDDAFNKRLNSSLNISYGFADEKFKTDFSGTYFFGDYRTYYLSINAYDKIDVLFGRSENYNELTSTFLSLVSKYEFRDYYYSNGFDFEFGGDVFPVLKLSAGFMNRTDQSASVNTNFSIFKKDENFRSNPNINDIKVNAVTGGFKFDFRDYIEDGTYRRRTGWNNFITLEGEVTYSSKDILKSQLNFTTYESWISGNFRTSNFTRLDFRLYGMYNDGKLPYQMLYALPGNIDLTGKNYTFRTLNVNEIIGENVFTLNLEHDWGNALFRWLKIPFLKDSDIQLNTYLNIAYTNVSSETKSFINKPVKSFTNPFYEAGFGIYHILIPLQFEFTWKLNHLDGNNFRFGINAFIL